MAKELECADCGKPVSQCDAEGCAGLDD